MNTKKVKVWTCKIVIPDVDLPDGFDFPPRMAAQAAIESHGIEILMNASGWGGKLTKSEEEHLNTQTKGTYPEVYFAGLMDEPEGIKH